ncbi:MAG TPA: flagellar hook-basal body complex protein FliE [Terracidiphilus sp.]|nr:flagellar hook-basal body complex protein FliE [Terracidiphilus sp.]
MLTSIQSVTGSDASTALMGPSGLNTTARQSAAPAPFADLLSDAVGQVNQLESQARTAIDGLMTGTGVDVHQAMIAEQKADMAFELALSVRNKAVQAYQQVIGMQF